MSYTDEDRRRLVAAVEAIPATRVLALRSITGREWHAAAWIGDRRVVACLHAHRTEAAALRCARAGLKEVLRQRGM